MGSGGVPVVGVLAQLRETLLGADSVIQVSDAMGQEALAVFGSSSATIQWLDRQTRRYRTINNIGSLAPGEHPHPDSESYDFDAYPYSTSALLRGRPYQASLLDPDCPPEYRDLLEQAERISCLGAPVFVDGRAVAELWMARDHDLPYREYDERLACAVGVVLGHRLEEIAGTRLCA